MFSETVVLSRKLLRNEFNRRLHEIKRCGQEFKSGVLDLLCAVTSADLQLNTNILRSATTA
jgi:hypothetical protein